MVKQVAGWEADDGTLFKVEQAAKDHDFTRYLGEWFDAQFQTVSAVVGSNNQRPVLLPGDIHSIKETMFADRFNLLGIFKGLNGGSGVPPIVYRGSKPIETSAQAPAGHYAPPGAAPVPPLEQTPISTGEKLDQGSRVNQLFQR